LSHGCRLTKDNKKLSYRRQSAHLSSLYRTVQKTFRNVEPFTHESRVWQTDRRTNRQTKPIAYSADRPSPITSRA